MRLSTEEINIIKLAFDKFLNTKDYKLYLFGSRLHDNLKGGDIDLAILTSPDDKSFFESKILDLLVEIKSSKTIGDRRIDLKVFSKDELVKNPFLIAISKEWVLL